MSTDQDQRVPCRCTAAISFGIALVLLIPPGRLPFGQGCCDARLAHKGQILQLDFISGAGEVGEAGCGHRWHGSDQASEDPNATGALRPRVTYPEFGLAWRSIRTPGA